MPDSMTIRPTPADIASRAPASPLAGRDAPPELLVNLDGLEREYFDRHPDLSDPNQCVVFGTSGHRGSSLRGTFTEAHILAIAQAICDYRKSRGVTGPLFLGRDTHALSSPAQRTALEVLAGNGVATMVEDDQIPTPTPAISHAILGHNRNRRRGLADGIVITPSHNPPEDGGLKYNAMHGGPADTDATRWIQDRANELLKNANRDVRRISHGTARSASTTHRFDFMTPYVADLPSIIDVDRIRSAGIRIGADPLGGASVHYWSRIAQEHRLPITVVNQEVDPRFAFMTVDHDGKIRMDCSSPHAMRGLTALKDQFDVAFANDPDADRHGIVSRSVGLMNPNHYLAVAIDFLLTHRRQWPTTAAIGKTLVSSGLIDRVVASRGRNLWEVPVGFKWFVEGLVGGSCCFGGEESAGASFLRLDGRTWTTDKDGLILCLLAAEILARAGEDVGACYQRLTDQLGTPYYTRVDAAATPDQKAKLQQLSPEAVRETSLAGELITARLTRAPGNNAPIGGLKVVTANGWFAARPSGTEHVYKIYAESFRDPSHLREIVSDAQRIVDGALESSDQS